MGPIIGGRPRRQLDAIHAVEDPQHIEVRESLDVDEPRLEPGLDLQDAFRAMLRAEALRNLGRRRERGANAADWLERAGQGQLQARAILPARRTAMSESRLFMTISPVSTVAWL